MLCPEVWNFEAPKSVFHVQKGTDINSNNCVKTINSFYYNHSISVVLPGPRYNPQHLINNLLTDCDYYKVTNLSLGTFINQDFINNFIKEGVFSALSIDQRIDCDDCASVTPDGKIVLSLTKDSYEKLGLDGKVSKFNNNTKSRYMVYLDVLKDCTKPTEKNYKRIKARLREFNKFNFLISWEPPKKDICPSSVAKYFANLNYDIKLCVPEFKRRTKEKVDVPDFELNESNDIIEWLGAFSVDADLKNSSIDEYLSSYEIPQPSIECGFVDYLQWRGFFTPQQIYTLLNRLKDYLQMEKRPWISLHVQGFSDCPINWGLNEHHYYVNGDNSYTLVFNLDNFILHKLMCSNKYYKR